MDLLQRVCVSQRALDDIQRISGWELDTCRCPYLASDHAVEGSAGTPLVQWLSHNRKLLKFGRAALESGYSISPWMRLQLEVACTTLAAMRLRLHRVMSDPDAELGPDRFLGSWCQTSPAAFPSSPEAREGGIKGGWEREGLEGGGRGAKGGGPSFDEFWAESPKRGSKPRAKARYESLTPDEVAQLWALLPEWVAHWKSATEQRGASIVPHMSTWLNRGMWRVTPEVYYPKRRLENIAAAKKAREQKMRTPSAPKKVRLAKPVDLDEVF